MIVIFASLDWVSKKSCDYALANGKVKRQVLKCSTLYLDMYPQKECFSINTSKDEPTWTLHSHNKCVKTVQIAFSCTMFKRNLK